MARRKKKSKTENLLELICNDAARWCTGRNWIVRVPLLILMGFVLQQHLRDPQAGDIFSGLNLGIHELGHYLFQPFGEFMHVFGGSLFQCLVPIIGIAMFVRQRDYFAISFAIGWLGTNLFGVATYVADARTQELDLVSPGIASGSDEIVHDWNWLLSNTHLLLYDHTIAGFLRFDATILMVLSLAVGGSLCWSMYASKPAATGAQENP